MAVLPTGIGPVTGGFNVERSLRFNSADSAYLNRTFGTSTNQSIFTYSVWVKLGRAVEATTNYGELLSGYTASSDTGFGEFTIYNGKLRLSGSATVWRDSTQVFRDPSAWYHVILAVDTTQATAANRVKMYVNGSEITAFSTNNNPTQNSTVGINNNSTTGRIGQDAPASSSRLFDGYMAEANFIDGQALTPSSFGETDSNTGVWEPIAYSGTYGTNGFYLKFADNSGTTSTTLGKDSSGNGNNWTPNNFSVTAGAGNDSLVDTPTAYGTDTGVGGEVRGNYCTMNPLNAFGFASGAISNGNLNIGNGNGSVYGGITSTMRIPTSVPIYAEFTVTGSAPVVGITTNNIVGNNASRTFGDSATDWVLITSSGNKENNNSSTSYGSGFSVNDVGMIAVDTANGKVWFGKNGTWFNSGVPASGTNAAFTNVSGEVYVATENDSDDSVTFNFGQRAFAYTAPSGFKALCTQNLPTPTIGATSTTQANDYFDATLYTGNGASPRSVTGLAFQPDWVWVKNRTGTWAHQLFDSVRGAGLTKALSSNGTDAEGTYGAWGYLSSFNSDGFTLTAGGTSNDQMNKNAETYVAWNWKANGAGSSNTAGSITSTVSANTTSGFSIVTYTGTGSSPQSIGHGLGATPSMIFLKSRGATSDWYVNHVSIGTNDLRLNSTGASAANNFFSAKSSTTFTINFNQTGDWVAYCFAPVAGYSAFGSYTGNGSADGPFVHLGFRPKFFMTKRTNGAGDNWHIHDTTRSTYNIAYADLRPNTNDAENTSAYPMDILSNGIKWRQGGSDGNESGATYIYAAFAENPFKYSLAR